jgi:hypothetical protein
MSVSAHPGPTPPALGPTPPALDPHHQSWAQLRPCHIPTAPPPHSHPHSYRVPAAFPPRPAFLPCPSRIPTASPPHSHRSTVLVIKMEWGEKILNGEKHVGKCICMSERGSGTLRSAALNGAVMPCERVCEGTLQGLPCEPVYACVASVA